VTTAKPDPEQVLNLPMPANDSGAATIRGYLAALVAAVWREGEIFSGRAPFGSPRWRYELYVPLAHAGMLGVTADENGVFNCGREEWYVERPRADALILAAIRALSGNDAAVMGLWAPNPART